MNSVNWNFRTTLSAPQTKFGLIQFSASCLQIGYKKGKPLNIRGFQNSAREESRTPTGVTPQASETCASTNSATRAEVEPLRVILQRSRCHVKEGYFIQQERTIAECYFRIL